MSDSQNPDVQVGKKAKEASAAAGAASKKAGRAAKAAARDPQVVSVIPGVCPGSDALCATQAGRFPDDHRWVPRPVFILQRRDGGLL